MSTTSYVLIDYTDKSYAIEGDIFKTLKLGNGSRTQNIKSKKTGENVPGVYFPKTNLSDIITILKNNNIDLIIPNNDQDKTTVEKKQRSKKPVKESDTIKEEHVKARKHGSKKDDLHVLDDENEHQKEMTNEEINEKLKNSDYDDNAWGIPKKRIADINTSEKYDESAFKKLRSIRIQQETNNLSIDGLIIYQYENNLYNVIECKYRCKNRDPDPIYIIYSSLFACAIRFSLHDDYEKEDSIGKSAKDSYDKSEIRKLVKFPDYCNKNSAYIYYIIDIMSKNYFVPYRLYVSDPNNDGKKNYSFVNIISTYAADNQEISKNQEGMYNWIFGMMKGRISFFEIITSVLVKIGEKK